MQGKGVKCSTIGSVRSIMERRYCPRPEELFACKTKVSAAKGRHRRLSGSVLSFVFPFLRQAATRFLPARMAGGRLILSGSVSTGSHASPTQKTYAAFAHKPMGNHQNLTLSRSLQVNPMYAYITAFASLDRAKSICADAAAPCKPVGMKAWRQSLLLIGDSGQA
jgi:hypothetical protein